MVQAKLKNGTTVEIGKVSFTMASGKVSKDGTYKMTIFGNTYTGKYTGAMTSSRVPNGKGTFTCKSSDGTVILYIGQFKKGIKSGTGTLRFTWSNGFVRTYRGRWENDDLPNGIFSEDLESGDYGIYYGQLTNGLFKGKGEIVRVYEDGSQFTYKGDFVDNRINGTGVYIFTESDGDTVKYEGEFVDGYLNGKIKVTSTTNGKTTTYTQEYKNGTIID